MTNNRLTLFSDSTGRLLAKARVNGADIHVAHIRFEADDANVTYRVALEFEASSLTVETIDVAALMQAEPVAEVEIDEAPRPRWLGDEPAP
jgi:hypothetical protein